MSVESAKQFLEKALAQPNLAEMLKEFSVKDLMQAMEEMQLDTVAGGGQSFSQYRGNQGYFCG